VTKKFTYRASDATRSLEVVQRKLAKARAQVRDLEAEERGLKGFAIEYFDIDEVCDVEYQDGTVLRVTRSQYDMPHLDQEKVLKDYAKQGRKAPYTNTVVESLKVKKIQ